MSQDLKQIIRQEYLQCAQDPSHFMQKYCHIQHPQRGRILFNLYPFQGKVLNVWKDNPYSIVLKSRQLGISTLAAGYSLWLMTFHKDKNVLCLATTQETAKNMVTKVKFMYDNLPSWLKVPSQENNKLALKLSNGSQIKAKSSNSDAARSEAVSLLLIDEAAFIDNIAETWASAQQTLATGGGAIVLSTPYGTGNWFHQTWVNAENSENSFLPIKLPWFVHPERDQKWRDQQDKDLGLKAAAQECDCDFSTSGDVVFHNDWIDYISQTTIQEPFERRGVDQNLWVWESVDYSRDYMVIADVARGDGADSSTFHVLDIATNTQVAEFKGQPSTREFGHILVAIATEYNNALLVVESNSIGWDVINTIIERGYNNLYHSPRSSDTTTAESYLKMYEGSSDLVPGITINQRNRPLIINKFREYIGDRSVTIRSKRLIEEMKVFIWKNGRAEAQSGYNDDLVMPFGVGMFLRDTSLKFQQQGLDMTRAALGGIRNNTTSYSGGYSSRSVQNPYSMDVGGRSENINWLL
jgi:hypothetical protein